MGEAQAMSDLGPLFGADLTGAEVRYLTESEWIRNEEDVLLRRSKIGLAMSPQARVGPDGVHQGPRLTVRPCKSCGPGRP